jgi:hypothetical protein
MNANPFESFVTKEMEPASMNQLQAGIFKIKVARVLITDDTRAVTDEPESNVQDSRDWVDVNPVVYALLVCDQGIFHARFYYYGYKKWADVLRDPKLAKDRHLFRPSAAMNARNYAINIDTKCRIIDEEGTKYAQDRVHMFSTALGCSGKDILEWVNNECYIEVKREFRLGKWRSKLIQFSANPIVPTEQQAIPTGTPKGLETLNAMANDFVV